MTTKQTGTPQSPLLFEKFEIIECLKKDSHTSVYLAHHFYLGKTIILKTLDTANLPESSILKRFKREARILAGLDHPNIIKIVDFGTYGSDFYISFEYFESLNLREVFSKNQLDFRQKIQLTIQLLRGLEFAHQHQIIHRDIKPDNILVNEKNELKIADFGLARIETEEKITHKSSIVGTPGYMSPEQIRGEELTPSSDLFSVGIILCELFSGRNPFLGRDVGETINKILTIDGREAVTRDPGLSESIRPVAERLLQKDGRHRFQSATEVIEYLTREFYEPPAIPALSQPRSVKFRRAWIIVVLLVLAAVTLGIFFHAISFKARPPLEHRSASEDGGLSRPSTSTPPDRVSGNSNFHLTRQATSQPEALHEKQEMTSGLSDTRPGFSAPARKTPDVKASPMSGESRTIENFQAGLPGSLFIQCLPWAEIYIDSVKVNTTPLENDIPLLPGEHLVQLNHPHYPSYIRRIIINPEKKLTISVNLDTLFGYLDCRVYPWGEIFLDGRLRGQTPLKEPLLVNPGEHRLTIVNPQFPKYEDSVFVVQQETLRIRINFEKFHLE